jgi:hypothetical protein
VVSCILTVTNTGNATLLLPTVLDQPTPCAGINQLAPAAAINCTVTHTVDQAAFDAWDVSQQAVLVDWTLVAETEVNSDVPSVNGTVSAGVALQSRQGVTVSVSVSPSTVTAAGAQESLSLLVRLLCGMHRSAAVALVLPL